MVNTKTKVAMVWHPPMALPNGKKKGKQTKQQSQRAIKSTVRDVMVRAPVQAGTMTQQQGQRSLCVVRDREPLAIVQQLKASDQMATYFIQPGVSGLPRLDQMAGLFEQYRIRGLRFVYRSATSSSRSGQVYMALDYDPNDAFPSGAQPPGTAFTTIGDILPNAAAPVWTPQQQVITANPAECNRGKWMYTSTGGGVHPGLDAACALYVGTDADGELTGDGYFQAGRLFVEYDIEFNNPVPPSAYTNEQSAKTQFVGTAIPTAATTVPAAGQLATDYGSGFGWGGSPPQIGAGPVLQSVVIGADNKTVTETWVQNVTGDAQNRSQVLRYHHQSALLADSIQSGAATGYNSIQVISPGANSLIRLVDDTVSKLSGVSAVNVIGDWFAEVVLNVSGTITTIVTYQLQTALSAIATMMASTLNVGTPLQAAANLFAGGGYLNPITRRGLNVKAIESGERARKEPGSLVTKPNAVRDNKCNNCPHGIAFPHEHFASVEHPATGRETAQCQRNEHIAVKGFHVNNEGPELNWLSSVRGD